MNLVITENNNKKKHTTIGLNMIVKNESQVIIETLNNLTKQISFDYWVISDTGSTDNTQQIITDYFLEKGIPGELLTHEWRDFGHNRTKALECAFDKTDYLLIFDADDKIIGELKLPFANGTVYADRYMLKFGQGFEYMRPLLINNRKRWMFKGVLHEYLANIDPVNNDANIFGNYYIESGRTGNRSQNPTKYYDDAIILKNAYAKELELPDQGMSGRYAFYCARSFKDAGEKYHDEAVVWYKILLDRENHWNQEKYYSALEIGLIYRQQNKKEEACKYFLKTLEYDIERIEGLVHAMEYYYQTEQYILVNALYHKFKDYKRDLPNKLFINQYLYKDRIEFFNGISAYHINDKHTGYKCCKQILINQLVNLPELTLTINNLMVYRENMEKDKDTLQLFHSLDNIIYKQNEMVNNKNVLEIWNLLFKQNREHLTTFNKNVAKKVIKTIAMQAQRMHLLTMNKTPILAHAQPCENILITFTTCKRLDLFKETINSILNQWTDVDRINHWYCVDDNSSPDERKQMKSTYNWIEYYMKTPEEKGHRASMNIIWHKLEKTKPDYWIHMEDDFLFYHSTNYIEKGIAALNQQGQGSALNQQGQCSAIKQVVFNRNYAETIENYSIRGHLSTAIPNIVLHDYKREGVSHYSNAHYWPHYSFRPSIIEVKSILALGNYNSSNQFFERDYANKWNKAGYKTAFFDRITHLHTGRLTSEINNSEAKKNAYQLNSEEQFNNVAKNNANNDVKLINLERRPDRKEKMLTLFEETDIMNYNVVKAVDGNDLIVTLELKKIFNGNDFGNRKGVIGCALSHLKLWRELLTDKKNNYYVIFEDDVTCNAVDVKERFNKLKPEFEKNDMLFLGYHMFEKKRTEFTDIYDIINKDTHIQVKPFNNELYIGGFFAYTINKAGAQKLVDYIEKNGIKHGIDYLIKISSIDAVEIQPQLFFSVWNENNKPIDTDIQTNHKSLDFNQVLEDQFVFMPRLDQIGHDIYYNKAEVQECMLKAMKDINCAGFNTLGFFKNKIDNLTDSQYFRENDGIYIKKAYKEKMEEEKLNKKIRVKLLCEWCSSEQLCKDLSNMCLTGYTWQNIEITWEDINIDYYVIINAPHQNKNKTEYYVPERTLVFQMEPWVNDATKNWGVKTWGEWAVPDNKKFLKVFTHKTHLNNVQWIINYPFHNKPVEPPKTGIRLDKIATICSFKNFDEGHILRNAFIKYVEKEKGNIVDVWGRQNYHEFKFYQGMILNDDKINVYANYKYCLAVENNWETNYATEKIWECILCESLCFYWGCPNLEDYIDARAFVRLPLEDPSAALLIIQQAIAEDWWTQRIKIIKQMKEKILNELSFFPLLKKTLRQII